MKNNVTYLKPIRSDKSERVAPPDSMSKKIEARLAAIESEMNRSILSLEERLMERLKSRDTHSTALTQQVERDFQKLAHTLETRVKWALAGATAIVSPRTAGVRFSRMAKELVRFLSPKNLREMTDRLLFDTDPAALEFDDYGMDRQFQAQVKPFFDFLYYNYWRVTPHGIANIPGTGAGLIVANHSGTLPYDGGMIRLAVENEHPSRRDVRFLVEDFVYHFPFLGTFMYRIGGVRACPENAERLIKNGHLVTVFPEGVKGIGKHYKHRYRLQRFGRGGFIKLALRTGVPIIPTAVIGAEEIHPIIYKSSLLAKPLGIPYVPFTPTLPWLGPLGLIPFPTKWSLYFGKPLDYSSYGPEAAEDQLLVNRLSEEVRINIQEMIYEGLKNRRSIWFG